MKKNTYIKMTAPFRENNRAARKLELINKICTYLVFSHTLYTCLLGKDLPWVSFVMTGGISNFSYGRGLFTIYLKTDTAIKPTNGAMIESASI